MSGPAKHFMADGPRPADFAGAPEVHGALDAAGLRFEIAVARFNRDLTTRLTESALVAIESCGGRRADVRVTWVPGAFELPVVLRARLRGANPPDAAIALGCVVEGETPHADLITRQVTAALGELSLATGIPVIDGVVAARTWDQAVSRCRSGREGRGWYAGLAAVEMATLMRRIREDG